MRNPDFSIRMPVYVKFGPGFTLSMLLGYKNYDDMLSNFSEEDENTCKLLLGPHSNTIFRMLLLKQGLTESQVFQRHLKTSLKQP
jgi:hypothetical protein